MLKTTLICSLMLPAMLVEAAPRQEVTRRGSVLVAENVRFQFLTPSLVRAEFSPSNTFTDAPSGVAVNRSWKGIKLHSEQVSGWLIAGTSALSLRYRLNSGPFGKGNLEISWLDPSGRKSTWSPGDSDRQNLGGLASSLDGATRKALPKFRPGILSRSGYFMLDDSGTPIWQSDSGWIATRAKEASQDWYFLLFGKD